jgi:hypothetical protein
MANTEETIWDTIRNSGKTRFDYKSLEADFEEIGDDKMAETVLSKIILGLSAGQTKESLVTELKTDMALIGFVFQGVEQLLEHKDEELKAEIFATQFARSMLEQGSHPMTILEAVHKIVKMDKP